MKDSFRGWGNVGESMKRCRSRDRDPPQFNKILLLLGKRGFEHSALIGPAYVFK